MMNKSQSHSIKTYEQARLLETSQSIKQYAQNKASQQSNGWNKDEQSRVSSCADEVLENRNKIREPDTVLIKDFCAPFSNTQCPMPSSVATFA